jgi:ribosome-associated protein
LIEERGKVQTIQIKTPKIQLGQFLKWAGIVATGGEVKLLLETGEVLVNGEREERRGRKLSPGDVVKIPGGGEFRLEAPQCN